MNDAFLMKMLSNLINKPNYLWYKVLYGKYGRNDDGDGVTYEDILILVFKNRVQKVY
jgi:hypothetical protein